MEIPMELEGQTQAHEMNEVNVPLLLPGEHKELEDVADAIEAVDEPFAELSELEEFLIAHDLQALDVKLGKHKLGLKELVHIRLDSEDFDDLCSLLDMNITDKLRFASALEDYQKSKRSSNNLEHKIIKQFHEERANHIIPVSDPRIVNTHDKRHTLKFMLVGNSAVGKTCILTRIIHDVYTNACISTVGIDFQSIYLDIGEEDAIVRFELWDTGGQERFRAMPKSYARRMDGLFFVYDITDMESFRSVQSWHNEMTESIDTTEKAMILVGAKKDESVNRKVQATEALEFATSIGAYFIECSAKTCENIMSLILIAAKMAYDHRMHKLQEISLDASKPNPQKKSVLETSYRFNTDPNTKSKKDYVSCC